MRKISKLMTLLLTLTLLVGMTNYTQVKAASNDFQVHVNTRPTYDYHEHDEGVVFNCNCPWYAVATNSWIKIQNSTGYGLATLRFIIEENTYKTDRTASILLFNTSANASASEYVEFIIHQEAFDAKNGIELVSKPDSTMDENGKTVQVKFKAASGWTFSCDNPAVTLSKTSGYFSRDVQTVDITIPNNYNTSNRTMNFTIASSYYPEGTKTFQIVQSGCDFYNVSLPSFSVVNYQRGTLLLKFTALTPWKIRPNTTGLVFSTISGPAGTQSVWINYDENTTAFNKQYGFTLEGTSRIANFVISQTSR